MGLALHISLAPVCEPGGARVRTEASHPRFTRLLPEQSARLPRRLNMEPLRHTLVVRFGTYEVSLQSGEVRKAGVRIRVQQQPLKLLEVLLERPGQVVTQRGTTQPSLAERKFWRFRPGGQHCNREAAECVRRLG